MSISTNLPEECPQKLKTNTQRQICACPYNIDEPDAIILNKDAHIRSNRLFRARWTRDFSWSLSANHSVAGAPVAALAAR